MKICYLSHINNYHTLKWVNAFAARGYEVSVLSLEEPVSLSGKIDERVNVFPIHNGGSRNGSDLHKVGYLAAVRQVSRLIDSIDPDIVHAHYASSYGLIASLACKRPYYLSVWGSDVYEFPKKTPLHRIIIKRSIDKAAWLMSTSRAMAREAGKYTHKSFYITPFGVDMELFSPDLRERHEGFVVGTVKGLESKYGMDILLRACAELKAKMPQLELRVRIAGAGSQERNLHMLADSLGMGGYLTWLGYISQEAAAREWASFDVACVPSRSESFGVSAVEAQACGAPVVISDVPGLMEACDNGKTAIVVPREDHHALADALSRLVCDDSLRKRMGAVGRSYVEKEYEVDECFDCIERIYESNLRSSVSVSRS